MSSDEGNLRAIIDAELGRPASPAVLALAERFARRAGSHAVAVLFYGSALRAEALDGVLDFYVLLDRVGDWPGSRLGAAANRLLPPNVGYFEGVNEESEVAEGQRGGERLRAKYALMSLKQFSRGMSPAGFDTTLWARFSQPCVCVWARSDADRAAVVGAVCDAVVTAARWAAALGPTSGRALDFWRALFARTYEAELRVERTGRSDSIVDRDAARYSALLPAAWRIGGIEYQSAPEGVLTPTLRDAARRAAGRRWARRKILGKPLNLLRLLKAAFTFDGAMDYVAWKIERHSGVRIEVSPWQRRFPLLAAPGLYWKLRRRGVLR